MYKFGLQTNYNDDKSIIMNISIYLITSMCKGGSGGI